MVSPWRRRLMKVYSRKGYEALDRRDFKTALRLSNKLKTLRHSSAFDIGARALWGMGERKRAIHLLEEGVQKAPGVFVLWDYLASFYSDEGWYDQAIQAYAKALECENAERVATLYNMALVFQRSGRHDKCIETLEGLDFRGHIIENIIVATLAHSYAEAREAPKALAKVMKRMSETEPYDNQYYWLVTEKAWAEWRLGLNERALEDAYKAVEMSKHSSRASWLIREITNRRSPTARKLLLHVEGIAPSPPGKGHGEKFQHRWYVVAENPEEGMEFVKPYLPAFMRDRIRLTSVDDLGGAEGNPSGVYELREGPPGADPNPEIAYWPKPHQ